MNKRRTERSPAGLHSLRHYRALKRASGLENALALFFWRGAKYTCVESMELFTDQFSVPRLISPDAIAGAALNLPFATYAFGKLNPSMAPKSRVFALVNVAKPIWENCIYRR